MNAEMKAKALVKAQTTRRLVEQFEMTESLHGLEVPTVRGWIMDELESRNSEAFDAWIDSDEASPRKFFL